MQDAVVGTVQGQGEIPVLEEVHCNNQVEVEDSIEVRGHQIHSVEDQNRDRIGVVVEGSYQIVVDEDSLEEGMVIVPCDLVEVLVDQDAMHSERGSCQLMSTKQV